MADPSDLSIEALAAQLFILDSESNKQTGLWWHQLSADVQTEYRKKATLLFSCRERREPRVEEPYDFDAQPWKKWMFGV